MSITGFLSDFSLPEIFRFIDNGNKTGVLVLRTLPEFPTTPPSLYYIWVERGSLVAVANQLNHQGLLSLIEQYQWISSRVVNKLAQWCPPEQSLGLYLKHQGGLRSEELGHLFQVQIVRHLATLSQLKDAQFKFDQDVPLPRLEMTGLSLSGRAVPILLKKLVLLQKLFTARKINAEINRMERGAEDFASQLLLTLDIAFFYSINLSLFNTEYTFSDLVKIVDLYYHPYNLPKSRFNTAIEK